MVEPSGQQFVRGAFGEGVRGQDKDAVLPKGLNRGQGVHRVWVEEVQARLRSIVYFADEKTFWILSGLIGPGQVSGVRV